MLSSSIVRILELFRNIEMFRVHESTHSLHIVLELVFSSIVRISELFRNKEMFRVQYQITEHQITKDKQDNCGKNNGIFFCLLNQKQKPKHEIS